MQSVHTPVLAGLPSEGEEQSVPQGAFSQLLRLKFED